MAKSGYVSSNSHYTKEWQKNAFVPIMDGPAFESEIEKIRFVGTNSANLPDRSSLLRLIREFALMHLSTNYEIFEDFRFPSRKGEFFKARLDDLGTALKKVGVNPPENPDALLRTYWEKIEVPERAESNAVWTAIALEKATIEVETTSRLPASLQDYALHRENIHALNYNPVFVVSPTARDVLRAYGTLQVATFGAIFRKANGNAGPYYFRAYWNPEGQVWMPWEFVESAKTDYFYLY